MAVSLTEFAITLLTALAAVLAVIVVVHLVVRLSARRWVPVAALHRQAGVPFRLLLLMLVVGGVVGALRPEQVSAPVWGGIHLVLRLAAIGSGAWLIAAILLFLEDLGLRRYQTDATDDLNARRLRTQILVIRRLTIALVVLIAFGAGLLSFPGVRTVGASLLASAGLISVVAAVAAQSALSNLFAGIQLAFSDAIRLGDVVVVDGHWGRIEELTLSYVVVHVWDDRRLVLPSTYFTTQPFENWTRRNSELLGAVEIDLDWRVDVGALRVRLDEVLADTDLWDRRTSVVQVTDAVGGLVRVRVLVTAVDAPTLFDLRCHVREQIVEWARAHAGAEALPRRRVELVGNAPSDPGTHQSDPFQPGAHQPLSDPPTDVRS